MAKLLARLADGRTLAPEECASVDHLPIEQVVELLVVSDVPGVQPVLIMADVANGERVHRFTRNVIKMDGSGAEQGRIRVEVFELKKEGKTLARLYWHPETGPVLSSQDLYF